MQSILRSYSVTSSITIYIKGGYVVMRIIAILLISVLFTGFGIAGTISGKVTGANGEPLAGANIYLESKNIGAATDENGAYSFEAGNGTYNLICDYVGYAKKVVRIEIKGDLNQDFELVEYLFAKTIEVLAYRAQDRETPVAFTNVEKQAIESRLGSRDIPMVLNVTPSVYATQQGGGAGDARMNIRGFNQRNVAIMINGVPVNDMENGWVYWSNWDGVGDAASSIQVQRGLSAVNLATPSIGGTMNVLTDPTAQNLGFRFKQESGNDGFLKTTFLANSGLIRDKFAFSGALVRKVGDGLVDQTWTDAWAYYFGASWIINANNRLELFALGAPQRHGENTYRQNIAIYSKSFAESLDDYDPAAFDKYKESNHQRKYNQTWGPVRSSYTGKQYWNGSEGERYDPGFINERENYFHKPVVNLNWYSQLFSDLSLYSTLYYSGGTGGGTGTYDQKIPYPDGRDRNNDGKVDTYSTLIYDNSAPSRIVDWNKNILMNQGSIDIKNNPKYESASYAILRNSVNNQWTVGFISKAYYKISDAWKASVGVDWRTAELDHFREVRDLLGGAYYKEKRDQFHPADSLRGLGDKIDYNFTNTVDWLGAHIQSEYNHGPITGYGMFGWSVIKYGYTNHFIKDPVSGGELKQKTDFINGYQIKGGASYRLTRELTFFGNLGYVAKVPIFDDVIDDRTAIKAADPQNEKFTAFEGGVDWRGLGGKLAAKGNLYYTLWQDRANSRSVQNADGTEGIVFITGMDQRHYGAELEVAYQPISLLRFELGASVGNWIYLSDLAGEYKDYSQGPDQATQKAYYYVMGLRVGDAPQTQLALSATIFPVPGLQTELTLKHYRDYYADWDPFSRTNRYYPDDPETPGDRGVQSWKAPAYSVMDFHAVYTLPYNWKGIEIKVFAHVFNLFDTEYIQDAIDNSSFNSFDKDHDADDAEVFFGLPRFFNLGLTLTY